ncbi:MAG: hypothetical protein Q8K50_18035 [Hydrogenophaga sp.]|nr:hypothetical protein [Hydrogenophaga sp.]
MPLLSLETPEEIHVLWRLMFDAKFQTALRDKDLWSSPWVHELARKIDEARLRAYEVEGKPQYAERHLKWKRSFAENPLVSEATSTRLKEMIRTDWWKSQTAGAQLEFVRGCLAPYEAEDDELVNLIRAAEA